jgi:hypothetical protein
MDEFGCFDRLDNIGQRERGHRHVPQTASTKVQPSSFSPHRSRSPHLPSELAPHPASAPSAAK